MVEYGKPSGVVRGECRGGLGGAAAPNRPPSAARRAGGPNKKQRKSPRTRRAGKSARKTKPFPSVPAGQQSPPEGQSLFHLSPQGKAHPKAKAFSRCPAGVEKISSQRASPFPFPSLRVAQYPRRSGAPFHFFLPFPGGVNTRTARTSSIRRLSIRVISSSHP